MYLRNRPVERDEVVIRDYQIITLPAEVCPPSQDIYRWPTTIAGLVEPLFNEIKAEGKAAIEAHKQDGLMMMGKGLSSHFVAEGIRVVQEKWKTHFPHSMWDYRDCRYCGRKFAYATGHPRIRHCSNVCIAASKVANRDKWVQRRSGNRLNDRENHSRCKHCGTPIAAERGSKRYCSGRCRIAAHRKRKAKPVDLHELGLL